MALSSEAAPRSNEFCDHFDDEGDGSLWTTILAEVQSASNSKLPSYKNLLILGDNLSGKTTLVAKLQGNEDPEKGSGLEYFYVDVKDEYREEQARLGVWVVDGDPTHAGLLKYALTVDSFEHSLAIVAVSMAQPWAIVKSINNWCSILADHIDRLGFSSDRMKEYQNSLVHHFQEYSEPEGELFSSTQSLLRKSTNPLHPGIGASISQQSDCRLTLPLPDGVLTQNLGIPIIFVLTKSDEIAQLEKEYDYREEHFDFIQQHIRKISLMYGAALFYISVKADKNCDLLYRYIAHRIYGLSFSSTASVVDRDAVFIPAGWDSEKKIAILYDNMVGVRPDDAFEQVIHKPSTRRPVQREVEVAADDDQEFLTRHQAVLVKNAQSLTPDSVSRQEAPPSVRPSVATAAKSAPVAAAVAAASRSAASSASPSPSAAASSPQQPAASFIAGGGSTVSPKKVDLTAKAGGTGETVLANFFNSLLSKKSGGTTPTKPDIKVTKGNIADELDRLASHASNDSSS